jgi:DNA-binding NarL/FixJ family response regulator
MQGTGQARLAAAGVTVREAEILAAIGRRLSNREIADRMVISVRTVESHVSALFTSKLASEHCIAAGACRSGRLELSAARRS